MKKVIIVFTLLLFAATLSIAKPITLRFAHQNPATGLSSINCVDPWLNKIEEVTGNRVKIQRYYGQTLSKGKDIWNATKMGIADIGWCFHGYWPGMTPLSDVISLPGLPFKTAEEGSAILWKLYDKFPEIQKEYKDVKVLLFYTSDPYTLITVNKPVKTLEDLKGMKIRMTGGPPTDMVRALGGTPMLIPMPDNYLSMQKGVIDGMGAPWEAINVWRFYEVAKYYTEVPFPAVYFSISMNKRKWDSLPKDIQDAIATVSGEYGSRYWGRNFFDRMKTAGMEKVKAGGDGGNIFTLSDQERSRWLEKGGKPIWDKWVEKMEKQGHANARHILDFVLNGGQ
ncbi:MAG: TRAP transporter substrate-binding protein [Desulfobacter sp.]|nr:MAG: TRAP transporter substrate-binding protein [Desulfobacter sp.]